MREKSNSITTMDTKLGPISIKVKKVKRTLTLMTDIVELVEVMNKREMAMEREIGETTQLNMPREMTIT